jgi:hypothetical protein
MGNAAATQIDSTNIKLTEKTNNNLLQLTKKLTKFKLLLTHELLDRIKHTIRQSEILLG